jgi:two-component system cell cycle sensor histidine kinase/response regulator CckA
MNTPGEANLLRRADWLPIVAGILISLAMVWLVAREPLVLAGYAAGLFALGGAAHVFTRRAPAPGPVALAEPDWSVTVAAIERGDAAVAVTDRAGRLVCANARYEQWFGAGHAPPRLPVDAASLERLARAARDAWRDGNGSADPLAAPTGHWRAEAERSGRGEAYLVWRIVPLVEADPVADLVPHLHGKLGRMLSRAGFAVALVDPDGRIRAASEGFSRRATGDGAALLTGQEFVSFLQQDDHDQISWVREGKRGAPLTLYYLPVADPDLAGEPDPETTPSLMLLADSGAGLGGGVVGEGSAAASHLEALLGQLPLGLAMVDRDGRMLFANPAFMRAAGLEDEPPPT